MDSHHGRPSMMPLRAFEKLLLASGCVFEKSNSSHHFYRAPSGRRIHLSGKVIGPNQQREILRQLEQERQEQRQEQRERQMRERQARQGGREHAG